MATLGLVAEGVAAATFVVLHVLRQDLDPVRDPLSFYAVGEWGWLFAAGCLAMALALLALALATRRAGHPPRVTVSLVVSAAALVVIAAFPTDPWMPWDRGPTATGAVHNIAFALLVAGFVVAGWSMRRDPLPAGRTLDWLAWLFVVVFVVTVAAVVVVLVAGGTPGFVGLLERVQFGIGAVWVAGALNWHRPRRALAS